MMTAAEVVTTAAMGSWRTGQIHVEETPMAVRGTETLMEDHVHVQVHVAETPMMMTAAEVVTTAAMGSWRTGQVHVEETPMAVRGKEALMMRVTENHHRIREVFIGLE